MLYRVALWSDPWTFLNTLHHSMAHLSVFIPICSQANKCSLTSTKRTNTSASFKRTNVFSSGDFCTFFVYFPRQPNERVICFVLLVFSCISPLTSHGDKQAWSLLLCQNCATFEFCFFFSSHYCSSPVTFGIFCQLLFKFFLTRFKWWQ